MSKPIIQPHVKLIHLSKLTDLDEIKRYIVQHKTDTLFKSLLSLSISPEYKFLPQTIQRKLKHVATIPTTTTFGKFRTLIYQLEHNHDRNIQEYLDTLDDVTAYAYSLVLARETFKLSPYNTLELLGSSTKMNKNEHPLEFGFPSLPCIAQAIPKNTTRVNVGFSFGVATLTTLDGRRVEHTVELQTEMDNLVIAPDSWLTGYIVDEKLIIVDYYFLNPIPFSNRFKELEKLQATHNFHHIEVTTTTTIYSLGELQYFAKLANSSGNMIITKQDTVPEFGGVTLNHILLNPTDLI